MNTKKNSPVGSLQWVSQRASQILNPGESYQWWVMDVFGDPAQLLARSETSDQILRYAYSIEGEGADAELVLSDPVEVRLETTVEVVEKSSAELAGPFVMKNARRQIAYAAVLVPGEPDFDGDVVTAEKVEQVAHEFMLKYQNVDAMHTLNNIDGGIVESYLLPTEMQVTIEGDEVTLPVGTWIAAHKFASAEDWARVEKGEWNGFSIMGVPSAALKAATKSVDGTLAVKAERTTLEDLGDWVVTHVSVVDTPAVPKAKWFALKSKETTEAQELFASVSEVLGLDRLSAKASRSFASKGARRKLEALNDALTEVQDEIRDVLRSARKGEGDDTEDGMSLNEDTIAAIKAAVTEAVGEATETITDDVKSAVLDEVREIIDNASDEIEAEADTIEDDVSVEAVEASVDDEDGDEDEGDGESAALTADDVRNIVAESVSEAMASAKGKGKQRAARKGLSGQDDEQDDDFDGEWRDSLGRAVKRRY